MAVSENDLVVGPIVPLAGVYTISIDFFFEVAAWLEVYKSGSEVPLVLNVDYTVSGAGSGSGVITLATPANGVDAYSVYLIIPFQRSSDMQLRGEFKSEPFNIEMDRVWQALQGIRTRIGRMPKLPQASTDTAPLLPAKEVGKALVWGADGNLINASTDVGDIAADVEAAEAALAEIRVYTNQEHPLGGGSLTMAYDPETLTAHPGGLLHDPASNKVWRFYTETVSHDPTYGMSVYAEYSDDAGATWRGKRTIWAGLSTRRVLAIACRYVNGRYMVIVNTEASGIVRYLDLIYSDDNGTTWSSSSITKPGGVEPFMFDALHPRNTAAGGDDDEGAIFYCYNSGSAYAFYTNDKGATWANAVVMNGASSYLDAGGLPATGLVPTEIAVGQVGSAAQFVFYIRCDNYANMICATSTDMLTLTGLRDSGIENEGPSLAVGTPPHFIEKDGDLTLYLFGRESWVSHDVTREQALLFYSQDAALLYAAGGVFTNKVPRVAARLPTRATGMMSHVAVPGGTLAMFRAGETVYADLTHPATSQIYQMTSYPLPSNPVLKRPNMADNPDFALWARGTSFTGITADNVPVAERYQLYASSSGGGDTMSAVREIINADISKNLPHRPKYGLRLTSSGAANSGIQQVYRGLTELNRFADREITLTFFGVGALPTTCLASVIFDYGSGGSSDVTISAELIRGREDASGLSCASVTLRCPTVSGKTLGSDPAVIIRLSQTSAVAWNYLFVGFKVEAGSGATVLVAADEDVETAKALRYFRDIPPFVNVTRRSTTLSVGPITHPPMVRLPDLVVVNPGNFEIKHIAGTTTVTGLTVAEQDDTGMLLDFAHGSVTSYNSGYTRLNATGSLALEAE